MQFSFSLVLSAVFLAYMMHSIYSLVQIFIPPTCSEKHCLRSFLATKPKLQLILCSSTKASVSKLEDLNVVDKWLPFEYDKDFISKNITIPLPRSTRRNGTLFIFAFVTPQAKSPKENWGQSVRSPYTMNAMFKLTQYLVPEAETFNLLKSDNDVKEDKKKEKGSEKSKPIAHIAKRLRLAMLTDLLVLPTRDLPQDFAPLLRFTSSDTYLPPIRFDKFNSRIKDFYPVNASDESYTMEFEFSPMSIGHIRMGYQFEQAMEMMQGIGFSIKDMDEVKGIFTETNVYLLALTMFVATVHLLFDFLAFKNDIIYWQNRKTTVGLSSKTILWRCFSQIVVFLYLLEEKSSLLIIIPGGLGAVIEMWKVTKAYKMSFAWEGSMPRLRFGQLSASEKKTADHDVESMKYLSYILYPLILAGAVYSLLYTPHRSWYSWTIQSMVNGVYAFGFLFMLPQLFVNYRLKSVAHLPWRAFMYKAFNTFIDDLFAFIITMPTAHRMACFRDDIVFIIYLYQRWLYPVDKSRLDAGGEFELEVDGSQSGATSKSKKDR